MIEMARGLDYCVVFSGEGAIWRSFGAIGKGLLAVMRCSGDDDGVEISGFYEANMMYVYRCRVGHKYCFLRSS